MLFISGSAGIGLVVSNAYSLFSVATGIVPKEPYAGVCPQALALGVQLILAMGAYPAFCLSHMLSTSGKRAAFNISVRGHCQGGDCKTVPPKMTMLLDCNLQVLHCAVN